MTPSLKPFRWPMPKRQRVEPPPAADIPIAKEELTGIVKGYPATDIEERMYIAFLHNGVNDDDIEFQPSYIAGRNMSGEIRPDFATYQSALIQLWFADEDYWHRSAEQRSKDEFNDSMLFSRLQGQIEFPIRISGDDLATQDLANEAVGEWVG